MAKTQHNEVAPGQFEIAPIFENSNIAADHNQIMMSTIDRVAERHGLKALLHEKPFQELMVLENTLNWSMPQVMVKTYYHHLTSLMRTLNSWQCAQLSLKLFIVMEMRSE